MNNWKEYKNISGERIFILFNNTNSDIFEAEKQITSMGYIIIAIGQLSIGFEVRTVIKAVEFQEDGLKEASL